MRRGVTVSMLLLASLAGCESESDSPPQVGASGSNPSPVVDGATPAGQPPAQAPAGESLDPKDWKTSYRALLANFKVLPGKGENGADAIDFGPFAQIRRGYFVANDIRMLKMEGARSNKLDVTKLKELEKELDAINAIDTTFEWQAKFRGVKNAAFGWQAEFDWPAPPKPLVIYPILEGDNQKRLKWFDLKPGQIVKFKGSFYLQPFSDTLTLSIELIQ